MARPGRLTRSIVAQESPIVEQECATVLVSSRDPSLIFIRGESC